MNREGYLNSCCFTGHRPEKLTRSEADIKAELYQEIRIALADGFTSFLSGVARGTDLWAAQIVLDLKKKDNRIQLICAVPYQGVEKNWSLKWQELYHAVLFKASSIQMFDTSFSYPVFQMRNRWMIDHSKRLIAVYAGKRGGTCNTIAYAKQKNIEIHIIPG